MSSDLEKLQSPQVVMSFTKSGVEIDLKNWDKGAVSPVLMERAFAQVHQTIHQYRAKMLHKMQVEEAAKAKSEATRDQLTEGAKHV